MMKSVMISPLRSDITDHSTDSCQDMLPTGSVLIYITMSTFNYPRIVAYCCISRDLLVYNSVNCDYEFT